MQWQVFFCVFLLWADKSDFAALRGLHSFFMARRIDRSAALAQLGLERRLGGSGGPGFETRSGKPRRTNPPSPKKITPNIAFRTPRVSSFAEP